MFAGHSIDGRHFLGLRMGRQGRYEIVYEAAANGQRLIWTIKSESVIADALSTQVCAALSTQSVLESLRAGLLSAEIEFEVDLA